MKKLLLLSLACLSACLLWAQAEPSPAPASAADPASPVASVQPAAPAAVPEQSASPAPQADQSQTSSPAAPASVSFLVLNLYGKALDFQFGDPGLSSLKAIAPNQPSKFFTIGLTAKTWLFFKESTQEDWKIYADLSGKPIALDFADKSRQLLLIGPQGELSFTPIQVESADPLLPVVSLVNASSKSLDTLQLVKVNTGDLFKTPKIAPARMSIFASLDKGLYTLGAIQDGAPVSMKTSDGTALLALELAPSTWTIALAQDSADQASALSFKIWNISE